MKKCNNCGASVDDQAKSCQFCGSADFTEAPTLQQPYPVQAEPSVFIPGEPVQNGTANHVEDQGNGNILAGFVGALLFSIIGGLLYFVIYQAGVIAGFCGLVIFVLANFGYGLFARTKNKASMAGLIASILATLIMIFAAEYFCISFEIYQVYKDWDITIFEAVRATPDFLAEPEIWDGFIEDLIFAYVFGFMASIGNIVNIVKAKKQKQAAN